ncbi:helix-turn-helix domain-containing protein [Roseovarius sp. CAU 1744]|uniref:helix-turn-helix transcriptional regulator n=1 Tax=Roseovarius sp. CAU 1744 TaxID=3140368 RepID=UPI00325BA91E
MTADETDKLVSVKETAEILDCSVATVWRRIADGTLPKPMKIGPMTRLSLSELAKRIDAAKAQREAA